MENIEIKVTKTNISITNGYVLNQGEYQVDRCKFTFSDEYAELVKKAIFVDGSTSIDMVILNDECNIPYEILQNSNEFTLKVYGYQVQNEELVVRYSPTALKVFLREGSYVGSNEVITPSQFEQYEQALHDGLDDLSEAMETMETTVNAKLGEMNEALEEVETATTEANNLNLDVSKSGKVATVTLIKKDASTKVVTLSDGTSLMFNWDGTKLGIKTDEDEQYTYVDLQGVRGETGLTPNIQIGTVVSGSTPNVTRTGTNENPILNFTLVKGDKGDTGNTGETGEDGNGIVGIEKTATSGLVDTYTITYTNGTTTTFNVTNGEDGEVTQTQLDETNARVDLNSKLRNALPKVTGTGTELTLNDTAEAEMVLSLSGNTTQETEPTPTNPQDIVNVTGNNSVKIANGNNTQNQTYPITLGNIEMASNTSVKDTFEYDKLLNKWYLVEKIQKMVLDGTETWTFASSDEQSVIIISNVSNLKKGVIVLSDRFGVAGTTNKNKIISSTTVEERLTLQIEKSIVGIVSGDTNPQMKNKVVAWLQEHNTNIQFEKITPTRTQITDTTLIQQLNNIMYAYAYQDQTHITQTNDGAPFNIDAEAVRDMTNIFDLITTNTTQGTEL